MSWRGTWVVYTKELRDITRDRRTIISMVLVPVLFYPLISIGMGSLVASQIRKTQAEQQAILVLPAVADSGLIASLNAVALLRQASIDTVRVALEARAKGDTSLTLEMIRRVLSVAGPGEIPDSVKIPIYYAAIASNAVRAVIELPPRLPAGDLDDSLSLRIYSDKADMKSETAGDHLSRWARGVRDSLVARRVEAAGLDRRVLRPFTIAAVDVAPVAKKSGRILAMLLPYMLMILTVSGGMYPALDITAGEKERNTLETLLVAPVARWELAAGKFLTVLTAALVTMVLATASMSLSVIAGATRFSDGEPAARLLVSAATVGWMILLMAPAAILFSSLLLAVSISARSFKEGQSYVTPLLMAVILPAMITFLPNVELNWSMVWVPVVGICLALKEVLMGTVNPALIAGVVVTTAAYAACALFVTARIFQRESVLFRT